MKTIYCVTIFALFAMVTLSPAFTAETSSLRCDNGIVSPGDTAGQVIDKCGQPTYANQYEEERVVRESKDFRERVTKKITIDDWTYNFGPNRFQHRLIMENGQLVRIETLGYGN